MIKSTSLNDRINRLDHARTIVAGLVLEDEVFLKFYQRFEDEMAVLREQLACLERARQLAAA